MSKKTTKRKCEIEDEYGLSDIDKHEIASGMSEKEEKKCFCLLIFET